MNSALMETVIRTLDMVLALTRPVVFLAGAVAGAGAIASWAVRARKISPFSPIARFVRSSIDPWLVAPMERRLLRAGGTPYAAHFGHSVPARPNRHALHGLAVWPVAGRGVGALDL
jgi:hypothetical protein